ncbi:MAG: integration host factor subunit beta [Candidatus Liberibacter europaeus]|uniref:Integration host factor subunit beta n=1 Tax=Candidatus Liberibacter europaeus TaxID=744859 RepID=A0A2T4VZ43_9HYPH|nr:integration host factor subunit beta [Candidatus Liberibacter europaeus]PTL87059.1 MAG: integration host factor subunit beta [Candidatus Liberibacter europaeus]
MIKSSLIDAIAKKNPTMNYKLIAEMVNELLNEMSTALASGRRIELRGFGTLSTRKRPARLGISPRSKNVVAIKEKWVPFFRSGKKLQERLNPSKITIEDVSAPE